MCLVSVVGAVFHSIFIMLFRRFFCFFRSFIANGKISSAGPAAVLRLGQNCCVHQVVALPRFAACAACVALGFGGAGANGGGVHGGLFFGPQRRGWDDATSRLKLFFATCELIFKGFGARSSDSRTASTNNHKNKV